MNDTNAPAEYVDLSGKPVQVRKISLNGKELKLAKLAQIAEVKVGLQTGDNDSYLFQYPEARGTYRSINEFKQHLLTDEDIDKISNNDKLRIEVVEKGISIDNPKSTRYFGGRFIAPYDKGGEADIGEGWLPNYYVPTDYFIDWSEKAVYRMQTLTTKKKNIEKRASGGDDRLTSRFQNKEYFFVPGISWSDAGFYSPTIRASGRGIFDVKGSRMIITGMNTDFINGLLTSKLLKMWIKAVNNHTVSTQVDDFRETGIVINENKAITTLVRIIIKKQIQNPRYDYASNEQLKIDRLVYEAYGLNDEDIAEVGNWYARRYPKLVKAQNNKLAAEASS
jgi:hypothetical protein